MKIRLTMKWEYKKTGTLDETNMNKLGKLGWELVAVIGYNTGTTASMFFKRQKIEHWKHIQKQQGILELLTYKTKKIMNKSVLQAVITFLFGNKYYANIINTKGTDKCEMTSYIHRTKQDAEVHKKQIESTMSFLYIETISFRSRKRY